MKRALAGLILLAAMGVGYSQTHVFGVHQGSGGGGGGGSAWNAPAAFASIPACSTAEFFQPLSDSYYDYAYCDGASNLTHYLDGESVVPIDVSGMTAIGSPAAEGAVGGAYFIRDTAATGDSLSGYRESAPSTPWTATLGVRPLMHEVNNNSISLCARETATGRLECLRIAHSNEMTIRHSRYNSATSFNTTVTSVAKPLIVNQERVYLHLRDDGTDITMKYGPSENPAAASNVELTSFSRTAFLGAVDEVAFVVDSDSSTRSGAALFFSLRYR